MKKYKCKRRGGPRGKRRKSPNEYDTRWKRVGERARETEEERRQGKGACKPQTHYERAQSNKSQSNIGDRRLMLEKEEGYILRYRRDGVEDLVDLAAVGEGVGVSLLLSEIDVRANDLINVFVELAFTNPG